MKGTSCFGTCLQPCIPGWAPGLTLPLKLSSLPSSQGNISVLEIFPPFSKAFQGVMGSYRERPSNPVSGALVDRWAHASQLFDQLPQPVRNRRKALRNRRKALRNRRKAHTQKPRTWNLLTPSAGSSARGPLHAVLPSVQCLSEELFVWLADSMHDPGLLSKLSLHVAHTCHPGARWQRRSSLLGRQRGGSQGSPFWGCCELRRLLLRQPQAQASLDREFNGVQVCCLRALGCFGKCSSFRSLITSCCVSEFCAGQASLIL